MKLDISGDCVVRSPSRQDILDALAKAAFEGEGFVILSRADEEYVQVSGGGLEYRSAGGHCRAEPEPSAPSVVEAVFLAYLDGGEEYRGHAHWIDVTQEFPPAAIPPVFMVVAAAVAVTGLVLLLLL